MARHGSSGTQRATPQCHCAAAAAAKTSSSLDVSTIPPIPHRRPRCRHVPLHQRSAAASDPRLASSLHAALLKPGLLAPDQFLTNHLLIAYFKAFRRHGLRLLDEMPRRNADTIPARGVPAQRLCAVVVCLGFQSNVLLMNAFLTATVWHGRLADAVRLFERACLAVADIVSWNTLLLPGSRATGARKCGVSR
ncbi:hypothetical protein QYE76_047400 [Lolium multiflorum]|uniref:Pentatricopeptide repeat-containing protein n=1 Tax=Lolium multiflorum TaxID=4521 RepID=A0AAD8WZ92_LOLMU|nr:hypothetical protein QYE76_047400 [Lolium multiflorum]